jgi:hypothetical protein
MDGFDWASYLAGDSYYGKGIPTPTPDPALVKFVKAGTNAAKTAAIVLDSDEPSPNGFADDEDPNLTVIRRTSSAPEANPSASPTPPPYAVDAVSYVDGTVIPNYWKYAGAFTLRRVLFFGRGAKFIEPPLPDSGPIRRPRQWRPHGGEKLHRYRNLQF